MTDKDKAVEHYTALALEAQTLADCPPGFYQPPCLKKFEKDTIVHVPYKDATWIVRCEWDCGQDYNNGKDRLEIFEVKIDGVWFDAHEVFSNYWIDQLQEALDAMPWNDE